MITDNPLNDAIDYINKQDAIKDEVEIRLCDLCGSAHGKQEMAFDARKPCYYCHDCIISGEVTRSIEQFDDYTEEEKQTIINQIK